MTEKEKLKEAKRLYQTANADQRYILESLFPELAESEEERIRKALINLVKSKEEDGYMVINNFSTDSILAWLEKQAQKPKWSEEDESKVKEIVYFLDTAKVHYASTTALDDCIEWCKLLKQRLGGDE